jgi:hypothetical protein
MRRDGGIEVIELAGADKEDMKDFVTRSNLFDGRLNYATLSRVLVHESWWFRCSA